MTPHSVRRTGLLFWFFRVASHPFFLQAGVSDLLISNICRFTDIYNS